VSDPDPRRDATLHCALNAAGALALFLDRRVEGDPPRCQTVEIDALEARLLAPRDRVAAVVADLRGGLEGLAGIVLCDALVADLLARLLGTVPAQKLDERARSALLEAGNIAISAAAGSLTQDLGERVLPSVPRMAYDLAGAELRGLLPAELNGAPVHLAEIGFRDPQSQLPLRFLWIPRG
jgi:chemotaxis protein CheY-P-specific phosphatase CheC